MAQEGQKSERHCAYARDGHCDNYPFHNNVQEIKKAYSSTSRKPTIIRRILNM